MKYNKLAALVGITVCALSGTSWAGAIDDLNNSWTGKTLQKQRLLDINSPLSKNSIQGSHNSFNSDVYSTFNVSVGFRYPDAQQKYSVYDQLKMGSRFIELDVHWTTKMESLFSYPHRLLLCHNGGSGVCSINDKYFTENLGEIKNWLNSSDSANQVLILYIEDHTEGHQQDAYNQLNSYLGNFIYRSGGCQSIPETLTKQQILAAGKKVIVWGDGGCRNNYDWSETVFTGLGAISRKAEDRTSAATLVGQDKRFSTSDIRNYFADGTNLVNLDDIVPNDGRLAAGIWSWDNNEPNNSGGSQDCALQWVNGRWDDQSCYAAYAYACENAAGQWKIATDKGYWSYGDNECAALDDGSYHFAVPTNAQANQQLKQAKEAAGLTHVWINHDDRGSEGNWLVEGK